MHGASTDSDFKNGRHEICGCSFSSLEADKGGTEALDTEECEPMADE